MAAIAIGEGVDCHKAMMEAYRKLIRRKRTVLDPVAHIVEHHADVIDDAVRLDADVSFGPAKGACPIPNVTKHALVQYLGEIFVENIPVSLSPVSRPGGTIYDVLLFCLIEITATCNPCLLEPLAFIRVKRGGVIGFLEEISHGPSTSSYP